jgi:hypothetical protein
MVDIAVELIEEEAQHLVLAGLFTKAEDGVMEITPKGSEWLRAWCEARLAETRP